MNFSKYTANSPITLVRTSLVYYKMIHEVQMKLSTSDRMPLVLLDYVTKSAVLTRP